MDIRIQILIIMAIANLLTRQVAGQRLINLILGGQLEQRSKPVQIIYEVFHCASCLSIWIGLIMTISYGWPIYIGLISMLGSYVVDKI